MKKVLIALIFVFSSITSAIYAQDTEKEEVDAMQAMFGIQKKDLIRELIKMTPEQSAKFWPIYDSYEAERKLLGKERVALIKNLADALKTMTPAKADAVSMQSINLTNNTDKLIEKYYKNMKTAVGSETAFEFYQAEIFILSEIRAAILEQIPLYGQVRKK